MNTLTTLKPSKPIDPEEIRRIAARFTRAPAPVEKSGFDLAQLHGVKCQWIDVTPAMAKRWLENNFGNRPVSQDTVKAYARDMVNKVWVSTHQGIAFNDEDALIDGQHRLLAIVLCGLTIRMMVTFGLPSRIEGKTMTTMDAVDRGKARSIADQLTIQHGFKNASITASVCASLSSLCFGERTRRLSVGQTLDVFHEFEASVLFVIEHRSKEIGLKTAGVLAGFAFAIATDKKIETLYLALVSGKDLPAGPLMLLHDFLTSDEAKLLTSSLNRGLAELVLQALYLDLDDKPVEKLEMSLAGVEHFRGLQVDRVKRVGSLFALPAVVAAPKAEIHVVAPTAELVVGKPSVAQILQEAERHFGIASVLIVGKSGDPEIRIPRLAVWFVARGLGHKLEAISVVFPSHDQSKFSKAKEKLDSALINCLKTTRRNALEFFQKLGVTY